MKKNLTSLSLLLLTIFTYSQTSSVDKSIFDIQTSLLGIWAHNESKLSNQVVIRTEIGLDPGIIGGKVYKKTRFILVPSISLGSRWYYNLNKRQINSKRIKGNNGNFLSLKTTYHSDWFMIFNKSNLNFISDIYILPSWGIRRNIGKHFNYETGFGIGYAIYLDDNETISYVNEFVLDIHLRIGYKF